ncbi:MAG: hypothetical protein WCA81_08960 [Rhizomicrobium sp.]
MRALLAVLLILPLAGCHSDQKAASKRCVAKAKAENARSADQSEEEYIDSLDRPIDDCMRAAGYYYYSAQPACDGSHSNPGCFGDRRKW